MESKGKEIVIGSYRPSDKRNPKDTDTDGHSRVNLDIRKFFNSNFSDVVDVRDVKNVNESSEEYDYYYEQLWKDEFDKMMKEGTSIVLVLLHKR